MHAASREVIEEVIRRIVAIADPDRIILFGSAARGDVGPHSDLDLLVVKSGIEHRGHLTEQIYLNLVGVGTSIDVVVVTPDEVDRYRDSHPLVIKPALHEGKTIYERAPTASR